MSLISSQQENQQQSTLTLDILLECQKMIANSVKKVVSDLDSHRDDEEEDEHLISSSVLTELTQIFNLIQPYFVSSDENHQNSEQQQQQVNEGVEGEEAKEEEIVIKHQSVQSTNQLIEEIAKIQAALEQKSKVIAKVTEENAEAFASVKEELETLDRAIEVSQQTIAKISDENNNNNREEIADKEEVKEVIAEEQREEIQKEAEREIILQLETISIVDISKTYILSQDSNFLFEIKKEQKTLITHTSYEVFDIQQHWLAKVKLEPVKVVKKIKQPLTQSLVSQLDIIGEVTIIKQSVFNVNEMRQKKYEFKEVGQLEGLSAIVRTPNNFVAVGGFCKNMYVLDSNIQLLHQQSVKDRIQSGILANDKVYFGLNNKTIEIFDGKTLEKLNTIHVKHNVNQFVTINDKYLLCAENGGHLELVNVQKDVVMLQQVVTQDQIQDILKTSKLNEWALATDNHLSFFKLNLETKQITIDNSNQVSIRDICCIQEIPNDQFVLCISYERNIKLYDRKQKKIIMDIQNFSKNGIYHSLLKYTAKDMTEILILKDKEELQLIDCQTLRVVTIASPDFQAPQMFKDSLHQQIVGNELKILTLDHYPERGQYKRFITEYSINLNSLQL